ncbi:MAG: poly-gamma-glutamate synthase PgsB [candidate division Zixibacteria bacterium RBG_16_53_22]|nr:MAG: poly-gamma-glutamate synthase PgsB [candidate division Zixibacteria bacterium RBG_16_53_22]
MWVILILVLAIVLYGFWEFRSHQFHLKLLKTRVHVNGTRGKSSVTRLITGGLRGGGYQVFGKTTGTKPRMLFVDGSEVPVLRLGKPNIIEQKKIVAEAARQKAEIFVTECMGVQPRLQEILEDQFIRSQIGVITNVRGDHLDEMGPTMEHVAASLANTIPYEGHLFTAEKTHFDILEARARMRHTTIHQVDGSCIRDGDMRGFAYLEHKDNVAVALAVCQHLGVSREDAFRGMLQANPDPGVLRRFKIETQSKTIEFVNAFAANDPDSYKLIWEMLKIHHEPGKSLIVLVNSRKDRIQRAEQLGEFIASDLDADYFIVSGEYTHALVARAIACGLPHNKISDLGGRPLEAIFNSILNLTLEKSLVLGIGNIVGFGEQIVSYFKERGTEIV